MSPEASPRSEHAREREVPLREARLHLADADATLAAGRRLGSVLQPGAIVTLSGALGAGKTTLVRGVLRALGWSGAVKSPTYTLVEHYTTSRLYFYHFDFYRLEYPDEWETTGFAEYFSSAAACVVEWPERVADYLPRADLALWLAYPEDDPEHGRELVLRAYSAAGEQCLNAIAAAGA
ncbi:MAG TPA: tRNA (adenosine(37)-N6)-threonylcarbamoyltransferase complex ATPase subunit type 1 TsaE [Casimicrobiaceae bacterium]|nr:tRNA (adenosine(37)-N6)-threonylcarbamoyltransferase complex ATPase subunit type 1 TsaE [Casimicrobiaceae bacterium]